MSLVVYDGKAVKPSRQAAGMFGAIGGMLAIMYFGAPLVSDQGNDITQRGALGLIAVSCAWGYLTILSQTANAHWAIADREIHEKIRPRFTWLPFGAYGERQIRTAEVQAWRIGRVGMGRERRSVIVLDVRGQPPFKIYSRRFTLDPEFLRIIAVLEEVLGPSQ